MNPLPHTPKELIDFFSSEVLTDDWRRIFEEPTTKRLITALKLAASPVYTPAQTPGVHHDTVIAHHWHKCQGVLAVLDAMERATLHPSEHHAKELEEEFLHTIPEHLRKTI